MEGRNDGREQQKEVDEILRRILQERVKICERTLVVIGKEHCMESDFIRRLWEVELKIARDTCELDAFLQ